ncbi:hypothetical protein TruAng_003744 [Truncatella angustata]|nr:hypothetical protein TruAng_003744 [Truncatella angustata]
MGSNKPSSAFVLKDEPIENQRRLKVRVIGAGYSGIYLGIRIPQRLRNIDLQIFEKNKGYSFDPNPDWSAFYAPQAEICAYLHRITDKYGVMRFVRLEHEVESCTWSARTRKWCIKIHNLQTGDLFEDEADILISARGNLSHPAWPGIRGLESFSGQVMHSALWKEDYDFKNKKVGVIGNGSSAIQIVPSLQKIAGTRLSCFVRSKTWITNPFGDHVMHKLGLDPQKLAFSDEQREQFANDPEKLYAFRKAIEQDGNTIHAVSFRDSDMQQTAIETFRAAMRKRLTAKPEIAEFLIPSFGVGCRRTTPGPGYLEALVESNVDFITDPIVEVNSQGVLLHNGRQVDLDCLVCATGFNASGAPPFPVYGQDGLSLKDRFKPHPEAYLSLAVDGFPNFFMMLGPNSAIGSGSLTMILETEGDYIVKCIRKLQKEDYASMEIKKQRVADWSQYCHTYFEKTVHTDQCNSWYKSEGGKGDRITGLWPGSTLHALEALRAPRWEDYHWENVEDGVNKLGWLGNGWSLTHMELQDQDKYGGDPAWYLEPEFQNVPVLGKPEEDPEYKKKPFSH